MRTRFVFVLLAAALAFVAAPSALADGDPASDYLITQKVFFPFDLKAPKEQQQQFLALVDEANSKGFTIRVALIGSAYDLGSITGLWLKPRTYARFLDAELQYVYKDRLLVVMPNGFGFNWPKHPVRREYAILSKIPIKPGDAGLVDAASSAVQALAKDSGVTLTGSTSAAPSSRNHDRLIIVIAALLALAIAVGLRFALRGRGQRP